MRGRREIRGAVRCGGGGARRRAAGGVGAVLRLLFCGVVDCRVPVRVRVVVLLWGAEGWSHEIWAGCTGMTEGVSGRSTREV